MNKKLLVILRAYGGELTWEEFKSFRPRFFNKFKCFNSLFKEFGNKDNVEFICIWDGTPQNALHHYIQKSGVKIIYNENPGNINSLLKCYEIAKESVADYIYFIEDDYIHLPGSYDTLMDLFNYSPIVSLYDHTDRYLNPSTDITWGQEYFFKGKYGGIRSAESTTCSFGIVKDCFLRHYEDFVYFAKSGIGSPRDRECFRHMITKYGYRLVTPFLKDSKAAHMVKGCFHEEMDWDI